MGNTISLQVNGVQRIGVSDGTLTGGAPGILASARPMRALVRRERGFEVSYASTDPTESSPTTSSRPTTGTARRPWRADPETRRRGGAQLPHRAPGRGRAGHTFGDGLATLESLDAQDQYNLTIIEPTFAIDPWYANNPNDPRLQYETFMTQELVPWIKQNLATTGHEQTWLIGFSKSGLGAQDLILKHPDLFTLAASWDFPADMATLRRPRQRPRGQLRDRRELPGQLPPDPGFVDARKAPFLTSNRIWIGGYALYRRRLRLRHAADLGGHPHTTETPQTMSHRWDSGWMPLAMAALYPGQPDAIAATRPGACARPLRAASRRPAATAA